MWPQRRRQSLARCDQPQNREVMRVKRGQSFFTDPFHEFQEFSSRISPSSVGQTWCESERESSGNGWPWRTHSSTIRLAPDRNVRPVRNGRGFRDAAISGELLVENVVRRDARWKAAGADDLNATRKLSDKHRSGMAVVAVTDRIQKGLTNCDLTEGGNGVYHHAFQEVLFVVPHVHEFPHPVVERQESLPILFALVGWAWSGT